jgi:hypothetical protein
MDGEVEVHECGQVFLTDLGRVCVYVRYHIEKWSPWELAAYYSVSTSTIKRCVGREARDRYYEIRNGQVACVMRWKGDKLLK